MVVDASEKNRARPFLKWAGGKKQLLTEIWNAISCVMKRNGKDYVYVELFLGGGAVLFHVLNVAHTRCGFKKIYVGDFNTDLINAYQQVKDNVEALIIELEHIVNEFRSTASEEEARSFYNARRDEYNAQKSHEGLRRAALLIFLNHTCYNGLYRVNSKGMFNVPYGKRKDVEIYSADVLRADSDALRNVSVLSPGDFEETAKKIPGEHLANAIVYFDPPYRPISVTSSFCNYTKESFSDSEQIRLAQLCKRWDGKHARIIESNSCTEDDFYIQQYHGFYLKKVMASRMLNSNAAKRGKINEVLITNYYQEGSVKLGC